jgi:hypothetical protein
MAGCVEGARGWYVWRCLRMELSRRRLSWSWSLFTWRRELRIPSLGARADGYATAPSERTTKAADSLLAKQRLVVWSRTTSSPPPVCYPTLQGVLLAKLAQHMSKSPPHPSPAPYPHLFPKAGSDGPLRGTLQQGSGNMAFLRRRMPSADFETYASAWDTDVGDGQVWEGAHPLSDGSWAALPPHLPPSPPIPGLVACLFSQQPGC